MTSMLNEPRAMNMLIDARIEQLRGGRRLPADPASARGTSQRIGSKVSPEVRSRPGADHGLGRRAAGEEDHRRDREHLVARRDDGVRRRCRASRTRRVSVSPASSSSAGVTALHGPAPRAPRSRRRPAARPGGRPASKLASVTSPHASRLRTDGLARHGAAAAAPSRSPRARSSRLIFEWPCSRSVNAIGTSTTLNPALTTR